MAVLSERLALALHFKAELGSDAGLSAWLYSVGVLPFLHFKCLFASEAGLSVWQYSVGVFP